MTGAFFRLTRYGLAIESINDGFVVKSLVHSALNAALHKAIN